MAQLGIIAFHRVGIGFAFRNFISAQVIPQAVIYFRYAGIAGLNPSRYRAVVNAKILILDP